MLRQNRSATFPSGRQDVYISGPRDAVAGGGETVRGVLGATPRPTADGESGMESLRMMRAHRLVTCLATAALTLAAGGPTEPTPTFQPLAPLNGLHLGVWTGQLQSLTHARDFNAVGGEEPSGSTSTLALTLNYVSPEVSGLSLGGQYVHSQSLFSHNPDIPINNTFHLLNQAYLNYRLVDLDLPRSYVRAGRIKPDFLMMNGLAPRQKEQAFEGALLRTEDLPDLRLSAGWFRKFSSWSTRHKNRDEDFWFNYEFTDVADVARRPYETAGTVFTDVVYSGIPRLRLNLGDWYSADIMNLAYVSPTVDLLRCLSWTAVWAHERSTGDWHDDAANRGTAPADLKANYLQTYLTYKPVKDLKFMPGYAAVPGHNDGDENHSFQDLFQADLLPLVGLVGRPLGYAAGSQMGYLSTLYKPWERTSVWVHYVYTDMDNTHATTYDGQEVNLIVGQRLTKALSVTAKLAYAWFSGRNGTDDSYGTDARLFVTYTF